mgnify:FL=1
MKNLLIVNIDENIKEASYLINKNRENLFILYLNNNIINKDIEHELLDELFLPEYASEIYDFTRNFSKTWHKSIESELKYFDLSLPNLTQQDILKLWPILLKIKILTKFFKNNNFDNIHVVTEYEEDIRIINEIFKNKNIKSFLLKKSSKQSPNLKDIYYKLIARFQNHLLRNYLSKKKNKYNIMFLGNVRQNANLLKNLRKNPKNTVIRAGENVGRALFTETCDYYLTFKEFNNKKINKIIEEQKIILLEKFNKLKLKDKIFYGVNLFNVLEPNFRKLFLNDFIRLIKYIEIFKLLSKNLDIVVAHNDVISFEKTVIKTANKLGIKTLTMIEGFLPIKQIKKEPQFIPFNAKIMAVHSEEQKKAIIKEGISKDRLVVTGYPDFDKYFNSIPLKKELIYKRYNIPLNKKIILYVGERYTKNKYESSIWAAQTQEQYKKVYRELFNAVEQFPDLFLIIKKHPSGSLEENIIKDLAKKENFNNFVIIDDMDIYNILNASYGIITRLSTMALEAMLIKKPVIIMDTYFDTNDNFGYTMFNAALHAKKQGDLKKLLKLIYNEDVIKKLQNNMDKFVNYNYSVKGNASSRMAELIENIIKK